MDFPGKSTGVGCHFLLQCVKVKSESEVAQLCLTLSDPMDCSPPGSSVHGICYTILNVFFPSLSPIPSPSCSPEIILTHSVLAHKLVLQAIF